MNTLCIVGLGMIGGSLAGALKKAGYDGAITALVRSADSGRRGVELGYIDLGSYFPYDKNAASNLDWFYHLTGGVTHTDFFAIRPTDYSKAAEDEDYEDMW